MCKQSKDPSDWCTKALITRGGTTLVVSSDEEENTDEISESDLAEDDTKYDEIHQMDAAHGSDVDDWHELNFPEELTSEIADNHITWGDTDERELPEADENGADSG